jgi:predicted HNH restriction endonuclease
MREANRLWEIMKGCHFDRGAHLAALSRKMELPADAPPDIQDVSNLSTLDDHIVFEGNSFRHLAIRYERSRLARNECINVYGRMCAVCGFKFGAVYGPEMEDLIHVHHLEMISSSGGCRAIDPARDMRPVCANCHYVMHQRNPPYTIEEVKGMLSLMSGE